MTAGAEEAEEAYGSKRGPSVGRILLMVNGFVLLVPVLAVVMLRIYEGHLVLQTESSLIAQSALIGEAWRSALWDARGHAPGRTPRIQPPDARDETFFPQVPVLGLDPELLPPIAARPVRVAADRSGPAWVAGQAITPMLDRAKLVNLSGARVLDHRGCVVATTGSQLGECLDDLPEVAAALAGRYHAVARARISDEPPPPLHSISRRGQVRLFTAMPLFDDGRVIGVVRMSRTSMDPIQALWVHRDTLQWALFGCLLLTVAVSVFFARTITRPVRAITEAAVAIARGESRRPLPAGGTLPAELHDLSTALDQMTRQLRERADYIADFTATASHELKTPLTGIRGAAELLREAWDAMDDTQRQRFLDNIDAGAERMQRLVSRLLDLARIENRRSPVPEEDVALRPVLEGLAGRHPQARVIIEFAEGTPETLRIGPDQLVSAVGNLIDNAVRHGGEAPVRVSVAPAGPRVCIAVADEGPGISEANQRRIFERFFTTARDDGGTGLGLAITRAIARGRGGDVTFETGPSGTVFRLVI